MSRLWFGDLSRRRISLSNRVSRRLRHKLGLNRPSAALPPAFHALEAPGYVHTFFGYYDRSPWSPSGNEVLLCATNEGDYRRPGARASVILSDPESRSFSTIAETSCWNFQQGAHQQFLTEDTAIYNTCHGSAPRVRIVATRGGSSLAEYPHHIAAVHRERQIAASIDFGILAAREADYGYPSMSDPAPAPLKAEDLVVRILDLQSGETTTAVTLGEVLLAHETPGQLAGCHLWTQIPKFNQTGTKVLFALRSRKDEASTWKGMRSDLFTVDLPTGKITHALSSEDWAKGANHPVWLDENRVLMNVYLDAYRARKFVAFSKFRDDAEVLAIRADGVGHPTPWRDGNTIITDEYIGKSIQRLLLVDVMTGKLKRVATFRTPDEYRLGLRCDLHPRGHPTLPLIAIDSTHTGTRKFYIADCSAFIS